ncbi:MAG: SDR family oxidoreductase [Planctomycetes bacterium]|nr:SDR family oxidoreductase [Planctomycetota bacterium]
MNDAFSLAGRHAVVTGGSRGIGLAIARTFAAAGAKVTLCSRKEGHVNSAVREIETSGGAACGLVADVGRADDISRLADAAEAHFGPVDVLVNNAATNRHFGPIERITEDDWDHTLTVNLKGPLLLSQRFGQRMIEGGGGTIVNIASAAGLQAAPRMGAYSVSKAALIMLTKVLAREWGRFGVRVNCICPGLVQTDLSESLWDDATRREAILATMAFNRIGQPDEIAGAALYLASNASSFTTGAVLQVDGGMVI